MTKKNCPCGSSSSCGACSALSAVPSAATSAAGLILGYGVASSTKNRPLGGAVLAAAGIAAGMKWRKQGAATTAAMTALYLCAFGGSHPLAKKMGAWPSVFTVAGATAAASWFLVDRKN